MKAFKKFFALLLALLMTMGLLVTTAVADGTPTPTPVTELTIRITNKSSVTHTYEAYQIFVGDLSETGVLSNVEWGNGIDGARLLAELRKGAEENTEEAPNKYPLFKTGSGNAFANATTPGAVAEIIATWPYNETDIKAFADLVVNGGFLTNTCYSTNEKDADGVYTITVNAPTEEDAPEKRITGYYLIKDVVNSTTPGNDGATDFLLQVAKNISIQPKASHPTFSKTVNKNKDGTFGKAISAQVGDTVWFKLEAKLPSGFNDYNAYHLHFQDIIPAGLSANEGSGEIYIKHSQSETILNRTDDAVVEVVHERQPDDSTKVTIDFGNLKKTLSDKNVTILDNDTLIIKYSATVTKNAVFGKGTADGLGNANDASMEFSNDMNQPANTPDEDVTHGRMTDSASVYVYQAKIQKIDSVTEAGLPNAEFYLYREYALDNGTTKKYAQFEKDSTTGAYKITGWAETKPSITLVSGTDGYFTVSGLDALTYFLEEYKAPVGYTDMKEDVPITIAVEYDGQNIKAGSLSGTGDRVPNVGANETTGTVNLRVKNVLGAALPTTGGMGTTLFYIVGGVLVMGAAAAFVMKRRNEA